MSLQSLHNDNAEALHFNSLLEALGPGLAGALRATGRRLELAPGQAIWRAGQRPDVVCFPESGLISLQATTPDGTVVEVGSVGADGAAGLAEAMATMPSPFDCRAALPASMWLIPAAALRPLARTEASKVFWRYLARTQDETRQLLACALHHATRERLADILTTYARQVGGERLPLTQGALSLPLGVCRTTVTALMVDLVTAGLVQTGRGWIAITDLAALERIACQCRTFPTDQPVLFTEERSSLPAPSPG